MLRKTDPGLTRGFGARFGCFVEVRFGITGNRLSSEPFCFPMANHDVPAFTVPMQNSPYIAHKLGGALLETPRTSAVSATVAGRLLSTLIGCAIRFSINPYAMTSILLKILLAPTQSKTGLEWATRLSQISITVQVTERNNS